MPSQPLSDLDQLLRSLEPILNEGTFVFASLPHGTDLSALEPIATLREAEGLTVVVPEATAERHQLRILYRAAWITLKVHSDLQAVGLTAAFAGALARAHLSCNVMAGAFHDHLFVPAASAQEALATLKALQQQAVRRPPEV